MSGHKVQKLITIKLFSEYLKIIKFTQGAVIGGSRFKASQGKQLVKSYRKNQGILWSQLLRRQR
jgi:hypothetical protein